MSKKRLAFFVVLTIFLLCACKLEKSSECPLPPKKLSDSDLVGTWSGMIETARDSTIIIGQDGRYKQIVNVKRTGFKYESDWQPWRVEYSDKGLPYLHLEGMMLCGAYYDMTDCTEKTPKMSGGIDWYDFCQGKWVRT